MSGVVSPAGTTWIKEEKVVKRTCTVGAAAAAAVALVPASSAFAGTYSLGYQSARGGNVLTYNDSSGDKNTVTVSRSGTDVVLRDTSGVPERAADGGVPKGINCPQIDPTAVACPAGGPVTITFVQVNGSTGANTVQNQTDIRSLLNGNDGNDVLSGGSAGDTLNGDGGEDTFDGGAGDDTINTDGFNATTGMRGEPDHVMCGDGTDTANIDKKDRVDDVPAPYDANFSRFPRTSCEKIVLEGKDPAPPPPGTPVPPKGGGSDTLMSPVGSGKTPPPPAGTPPIGRGACKVGFVGNRRANRFVGNDVGDRMFGRGGADVMFGFAGPDCLYGERGNDRMDGGAGNDLIVGGPGNDWANGGLGNDRVYGGPGRDRLYGGAGRDRIYGGAGFDRIDAGPGKDHIDSRDGRRDIVRCGTGLDTVRADRADQLIGCERRR